MTAPRHRVLGLCGSLRAQSFNMAALRAAAELMPVGVSLQIATLHGIPVYNGDDQSQGWPPAVQVLADAIRTSDGVLIASPEYNFSIPGGLKKALDWLSRLPDQPIKGMPVAILGAATGPVGTARMQYDLRKVLLYLNALVLAKPEVFCGMAQTKFDAAGKCTDDVTRKFATDLMAAFERWIGGVAKMKA